MSEITIKLAKSRIGCTPNQKKTLDALGLRVIDLEDEPLEGVAAGWAEGILVMTKSGGFGGSEALHALAVYAAKKIDIHQDKA